MNRYLIPAVVACLYIAGSAWLVRNEGRAYRDSLRPARAAETAPPPRPAPATVIAREDAAPAPSPTSPRPEPPARTAEAPPPKVVELKAPPPPPATVAPISPPPATAPGKPADLARLLKDDPIWGQAGLNRPWDLDHFTIQEENQLGAQLNALILRLNPEDTGAGLRRVKEAAEPLRAMASRKGIDYQFFVLNSEVPNAFSHPGGYIYISRKLLEMIPEDEQYLLEFVIGHEMAHVELQHALACLRDPDIKPLTAGLPWKLYFVIIQLGYPDKLEEAADEWIYHRMKRLGRSDYECLKFLRMLDRYAKAQRFGARRGKPHELLEEMRHAPEGARAFSPIDNHLRAHPPAYERLRHLKELAAGMGK